MPKLTNDWWKDLVYNNLFPLQRDQVDLKHITELKGLDLATLLRVFERNWFIIMSSWFVNNNVSSMKILMQKPYFQHK